MSKMIEGGIGYRKTAEVIDAWEKHFALLPVYINGEKVWMKTVYRRKVSSMWRVAVSKYGTQAGYSAKEKIINVYEYGTIFDVMKGNYGS